MRRKITFLALSLAVAGILAGCGGYSGPKTSTITGTVLDIDGFAVIGAKVWTIDGNTVTSTSGAYVLKTNRPGPLKVSAEIYRNGVRYIGSNTSLNFNNEQTQSVNIVVGVASESATIQGVVRDREGFLLQNVSVWAFNETGGSVRVFTSASGGFVTSRQNNNSFSSKGRFVLSNRSAHHCSSRCVSSKSGRLLRIASAAWTINLPIAFRSLARCCRLRSEGQWYQRTWAQSRPDCSIDSV